MAIVLWKVKQREKDSQVLRTDCNKRDRDISLRGCLKTNELKGKVRMMLALYRWEIKVLDLRTARSAGRVKKTSFKTLEISCVCYVGS